MITKREVYKKVYTVYNPEVLKDKEMNELLMCSGTNWNFYFLNIKNRKELDFDKTKNVELVEFDNKNEMFNFWELIENSKKIDWSEEHKNPCLLKYL